jgi:hypothetical protein
MSKREQLLNCWICGAKANSGEHKIKKSDLKVQYPEVSQKQPIYHKVNDDVKRPIGSIKAEGFKYPKSICSSCNGAKTQSHDLSWEKLSNFLSSHTTEIQGENVIDLTDVFESNLNENILNIQLYFAKLFGCKIVESGREFDLAEMSNAIRSNSEIPSLYIKLRYSENGKSKSYIASSDFEALIFDNGEFGYIHFYYTIGVFTVEILYCSVPEELDMKNYFLPSTVVNKLFLGSNH